jgi:2-amino-4-hydroxy-6-hydroxymethyldihydropteridine diphosphokinase
MTPAYLALGSNLSDPRNHLCNAVTALEALPDTSLERVSSLYQSAAVGPGTQPDYLNAVIRLATSLSALDLLDAMQTIEHQQGRVRDIRWGPRTLDIDLVLYGDSRIATARLSVPHPGMHERNFVLYPLREISDTNFAFPNGSDLDTLLQQCPEDGLLRVSHQPWINQHPKNG